MASDPGHGVMATSDSSGAPGPGEPAETVGGRWRRYRTSILDQRTASGASRLGPEAVRPGGTAARDRRANAQRLSAPPPDAAPHRRGPMATARSTRYPWPTAPPDAARPAPVGS